MAKLVRPENFKGRVLMFGRPQRAPRAYPALRRPGLHGDLLHNIGPQPGRVHERVRARGHPKIQWPEPSNRRRCLNGDRCLRSVRSFGVRRLSRRWTGSRRPTIEAVLMSCPCASLSMGSLSFIALDEKPKSVRPHRLKRVRNILANPDVSLLVDTYREDWSSSLTRWWAGRPRAIGAEAGAYRGDRTMLREVPPVSERCGRDAAVIAIEPAQRGFDECSRAG